MSDENNAVSSTALSAEEINRKMYENSMKALKLQKISTACIAAIFVLMAIVVLMVVPKAVGILNSVNELTIKAETTIDNADSTFTELKEMADSLQQAGDKMDQILVDNESTMIESMEKISKIDFDGLNQGIKDLQDTVGPLANFMSRFR